MECNKNLLYREAVIICLHLNDLQAFCVFMRHLKMKLIVESVINAIEDN